MKNEVMAYRVTMRGFDPVVVFAASRGKANAIAVDSYVDAGYGRGWPDIMRCVRAPELDGSRDTPGFLAPKSRREEDEK